MKYRPGYRDSLSKSMQTKVAHKQEEIKRDQKLQGYDDVRASEKDKAGRAKLPIALGVLLVLFLLVIIAFVSGGL